MMEVFDMRVAFFGAHPDDIELCMGGTLIKYKEQGHEVFMVIATDGCRGSEIPEERGTKLAELRKKEAISAAAHVGVTPIFLGFEDHRLIYNHESFEKFEEVISNISPDVIFTHDPDDYHSDHRVTSKLVVDTCYVPVFFSDTRLSIGFEPEFCVDITNQFDKKVKMVKEHASQNPDKLLEIRELQNRFRAAQCDDERIKYAEAFRLFPRAGWVRAYELLPK